MTTAALQDRLMPDNRCFGCGVANADGLHIKSYVAGPRPVRGGVGARGALQGPPGVVNGGVMSIPTDCHATWAAMHTFGADRGGEPVHAFTAGYSVRLIRPTPTGRRVELTAEVTERTARKAKVHVSATVDGEETATFDGTFVAVDQEVFEASSTA